MHENRILPPHLRQMGSLPIGWKVDFGSMSLCLQKLCQGSMTGWLAPILTQELAGLSIEEVQPCAGGAGDPLIFVFSHVIVFVRPMLDVHRRRRAGEEKRGHLSKYDGPGARGHDVAQIRVDTASPYAGADRQQRL